MSRLILSCCDGRSYELKIQFQFEMKNELKNEKEKTI